MNHFAPSTVQLFRLTGGGVTPQLSPSQPRPLNMSDRPKPKRSSCLWMCSFPIRPGKTLAFQISQAPRHGPAGARSFVLYRVSELESLLSLCRRRSIPSRNLRMELEGVKGKPSSSGQGQPFILIP